ncbi:MAG: hypothetical protein JSV16_14565 [Candidatus Hydrogenedentota bacterium]|nr:MAG: hypothetical protein JSV16_14565 [Candidatus Hydrogenedentota bacterium]
MIEERITCPLCGLKVGKVDFKYHFEAEEYILAVIAQQHPEWKEEDGTCKKCLDYYMELGK